MENRLTANNHDPGLQRKLDSLLPEPSSSQLFAKAELTVLDGQKSRGENGSPGASTGLQEELNIAIIDDEVPLLNLYSLLLRRQGHRVTVAAKSVEELVESLNNGKIPDLDIAIVDYRLGNEMNGLDVAQLLVRRNPKIKIIIASASTEITQEVEKAGFTFLSKPFSIRDLLSTISDTKKCLLTY